MVGPQTPKTRATGHSVLEKLIRAQLCAVGRTYNLDLNPNGNWPMLYETVRTAMLADASCAYCQGQCDPDRHLFDTATLDVQPPGTPVRSDNVSLAGIREVIGATPLTTSAGRHGRDFATSNDSRGGLVLG